jgi:WD40 repeat protein
MILYSSSEDHSVCEWDLLSKQSKQLYRHQASVQVLSLNSKSKRLLSGCLNQVLIIYSLNSSSIEHQVQLAINPCNPISEYYSILGSHKGKILIFHDKNLFKNSKIPQKHHPLLNTLTFNETIAKICKKINFQISDHLSDRTRTGIISADRKFLVSFEGENLVNIWKKSKFCAIPNCKFCNKKLKISFPV